MASLQERKRKNGSSFVIQFMLFGVRKTMFLDGKYSRSFAREIKERVERIACCIESCDELDRGTSQWLSEIGDDLRERLESVGLVEVQKIVTIGNILDQFIDQSEDRKASTLEAYESTFRRAKMFFDRETPCDGITASDCREWKRFELQRWSKATVAADVGKMRTAFNWAIKNGILEKNVFTKIKRGSQENKDREFFVPMEWYEKLLESCPDQTWRTIVALCRIGGLRCPSEVLGVRWEDVNWEHNRLLVRSPKTEHVSGHASRTIPLWSELRKELEAQFEQAEEGGSPFVIPRYHGSESPKNMRCCFERIIFHAGLPQWERIFHNLRGSRSNELFASLPSYLASYWMGQTEAVARKHYLHATDQDYEKALDCCDKEVVKTVAVQPVF